MRDEVREAIMDEREEAADVLENVGELLRDESVMASEVIHILHKYDIIRELSVIAKVERQESVGAGPG